ncbi:hypothetical protein KCP78_11105 [Salmonella enterica subsp. enterica]|nr:hypothetical protein KCP78_11105 [Salmonella enterica subsp. enterica]
MTQSGFPTFAVTVKLMPDGGVTPCPTWVAGCRPDKTLASPSDILYYPASGIFA